MNEDPHIRRSVDVDTPIYFELDRFGQFLAKTQCNTVDYIGKFYVKYSEGVLAFQRPPTILNRNVRFSTLHHTDNIAYTGPENFHNYMVIKSNGECILDDKFPSDTFIIVKKHYCIDEIDKAILEEIEKVEKIRKS